MNKAEYLKYLNFNEEEFSIQPYDEEWLQKIIEIPIDYQIMI